MWDLAVREEDYIAADSLLRRKFTPAKLPLEHRAILAIVQRDSVGRARILTEAQEQSRGHPFAPEKIARYLNDFEAAREFAQAALVSPRPKALRDSVHLFLASLALAQGRWKTAEEEFAQAQPNIPSAQRLRALSATLPFLAVSDSDLTAFRAELSAWDPRTDAPVVTPGLATALAPHLRLYLIGLLSSRLNDDAQALRSANELDRIGGPPETMALVRDLALIVRADLAARRGRPAEALKILEPVRGEMPPELLAHPFYSEEVARYLRAELLYRLGRDEEALRWFTNGFQGSPNEIVFLAPAAFRRAELYERAGRRKDAIAQYGRFVRLWQSCDPALRPRVDEARARLEALLSEPR
jgi:tetratricopeptide (TPR) repeat protein